MPSPAEPAHWRDELWLALVLVVLAALDFWLCWVLGAESVASAKQFAEMF